MKIVLLSVGKTTHEYIKHELLSYSQRLSHYSKFESIEITSVKSSVKLSRIESKRVEGGLIRKHISKDDYVILLDEKGKALTSIEFSKKIEKYMLNSFKRIVFIIGGPFGFANEIYELSDEKMSLSNMTFSHQMIRLFFIEQLYRAFTIINNEKYHHQ